MLTKRFAVHLNRSLVGLLGVVIEKTDVAHLRSFPCLVVKKTFQFTCGDPETEVDLILSRAGIFETPEDIHDFTICPTHRSNLGTGVGWIRCSISRCRVPREVCGHGNLSLLNFKCAARISTPQGTPIHKRARMRAGNFENDPYEIIKGT